LSIIFSLKSLNPKGLCRFKSGPGHQVYQRKMASVDFYSDAIFHFRAFCATCVQLFLSV